MNERLLEENKKAQHNLLTCFKEEIEYISSQWKGDTKEKAEKILNMALLSSKEAMTKLLQESSRDTVELMKKMISDSVAEAQDKIQQAKQYSRFTLVSSAAILTAFGVLLFEVLMPILKIR